MLTWLQLTPGGCECVCIIRGIVEKCVNCSSMQCYISCIQLQCHTVKSLWSAPRPHRYNSLPFYKSLLKGCVFDPQQMAAFHFCSPHVVEYLHLRWVYPCSPPLFVWLVQYTTQKWTNGQIRNQDMHIATTTSVHAMKSLLWFDIVAAYSKWQCWTISQSCMTGYWNGLDSTSTLWTDPQYIPQGPYPMSFPGVQKGQSACPPELMASIVITLVYPYTKCACTPASHPVEGLLLFGFQLFWLPV